MQMDAETSLFQFNVWSGADNLSRSALPQMRALQNGQCTWVHPHTHTHIVHINDLRESGAFRNEEETLHKSRAGGVGPRTPPNADTFPGCCALTRFARARPRRRRRRRRRRRISRTAIYAAWTAPNAVAV